MQSLKPPAKMYDHVHAHADDQKLSKKYLRVSQRGMTTIGLSKDLPVIPATIVENTNTSRK